MVLMGAMAARYAPRGLSCWPPGSKVDAMYSETQKETNDEWTGRTYDEPRNDIASRCKIRRVDTALSGKLFFSYTSRREER